LRDGVGSVHRSRTGRIEVKIRGRRVWLIANDK